MNTQSNLTENELLLQKYNCELWMETLNSSNYPQSTSCDLGYIPNMPLSLINMYSSDSNMTSEIDTIVSPQFCQFTDCNGLSSPQNYNPKFDNFLSRTEELQSPVGFSNYQDHKTNLMVPSDSTNVSNEFKLFSNSSDQFVDSKSNNNSEAQVESQRLKSRRSNKNTNQDQDKYISNLHNELHPKNPPSWLLPGMRQRGRNWNAQETEKLIEVMNRFDIGLYMRYACLRRSEMFWRRISVVMTMEGFPRSDVRCRNRWKVLVEKFQGHRTKC